MTLLKVVLILAVVLWLLSRVRLGGDARYQEGVFSLRVCLGPVKISVFPAKKTGKTKAKKEKKPAKPKKKQDKPEAEKPKRKLPPVGDLLMLGLEAAGALKRKIRIDELTLHLTWASEDPAETAQGFGKANALLGMIWPLIDQNFHVKKHDLGVAVDFDRTRPEIFACGRLTLTVGQLVSFGVRFGIKFLRMWRRSGKVVPRTSQEVMNDERTEASH